MRDTKAVSQVTVASSQAVPFRVAASSQPASIKVVRGSSQAVSVRVAASSQPASVVKRG